MKPTDNNDRPKPKTRLCGECPDFLYEDAWGYGWCSRDNESRFCNNQCLYDLKKRHDL